MQEWYLGWEKVSFLEKCPQFRSVFIKGFHCKPSYSVPQHTSHKSSIKIMVLPTV